MVAVVVASQVVHIAGADQRAGELTRHAHDLLVAALLEIEAVLLHLEIDVVGTERADQLIDVRATFVEPALSDPCAQP